MKLKHHFKLFLSGITLPVQSGPIKGKKWCATTGIRFIRGEYVLSRFDYKVRITAKDALYAE